MGENQPSRLMGLSIGGIIHNRCDPTCLTIALNPEMGCLKVRPVPEELEDE